MPIESLTLVEITDELAELIADAGPDERRVALFILRRLVGLGQGTYGRVELATDRRDFREERAQEMADLLVYDAMHVISTGIR